MGLSPLPLFVSQSPWYQRSYRIICQLCTDYLPVYLQASRDASALRAGIDMFGLSFTIPMFAIFTGVSIELAKKYRPQNYIGWIFTIVGFGLFTMLSPTSTAAHYIGFQIPLGIGLGILWISTQFPILAPLPASEDETAYALVFYIFVRNLAQVHPVTIFYKEYVCP